MRSRIWVALISIILVLGTLSMMSAPVKAATSLFIIKVSPSENSTISNTTPTISVTFISESTIEIQNVQFVVDGTDVSTWEEFKLNETGISYRVPKILPLKDGNHTVTVIIADNANQIKKVWNFTVDRNAASSLLNNFNIQEIMLYIVVMAGLSGVVFGGYYLYIKKKKRFTFKKYFVQNPMQKKYMVIYLPAILALIVVLVGFLIVSGDKKAGAFSYEYIIIAALFVGIGPFAVDSRLEKNRIIANEQAFSQFLFELADAIRGGIDPAKAVIEFAKVEKGIMKKRLKVASDGIRIGRPFEEMIMVMVEPMKSPLVKRYASLIGEASKIGGDIAVVIHRAAKDMDDLLKIDAERRRNLMIQATTIYISFGVLLIVIYQLIDIYPTLGNGISMGGLGQKGLTDGPTVDAGTKMTFITLKRRFFHLALINSIGAGLLIGTFTEGKVKMGLIHALVLIAASTLIFMIMIFPI